MENSKMSATIVNAENSKILEMKKSGLKKAVAEMQKVNTQTSIEKAQSILSSIESVLSSANPEDKYLSARALAIQELLQSRKAFISDGHVSALRIFASEIETYLAE